MKRKSLLTKLASLAIVLGTIPLMTSANAQLSGVSIDFAAAQPTTYDHQTGGGKWGAGVINTDITRSLQGEDFACEDRVSFLAKVNVGDTTALRNLGAMTYDLRYSFTLDSTGQSGVALDEPVVVALTTSDSANNNDGGSSISVVETSKVGAVFTSNSKMFTRLRLSDVEAAETIVFRVTVQLNCLFGAEPTGNLQAKFEDAEAIFSNGAIPLVPAEKITAGSKTVDLKSTSMISYPELGLSKTVTTQGSSCPGGESLLIAPNQTVRYCYVVTNTSNTGGRVGAPAFNLSDISDDSGKYPDFTVSWKNGLTDIDSDGQLDDLAPGASATTFYEATFDGDQDTTLLNTAVVYGFDAPTGGNQISATDTATVFIDAPGFVPSVTISKLTNGFDSPTVLAGTTVNWTYLVSNTGNVALTSISVVDDQGVAVSCPETTLAVAGQMTCTASGTAIVGPYSNVGTVSAAFETEIVTSSDASSYFGANPLISLMKTPDTQVVIQGETATFTIKVMNIGNVALTNLNIADPFVSDCVKSQSTMTVGEVVEYSCSLSGVNDSFTNTATATAVWESTTVTSSDSASVIVDYLPAITVNKSASDTSIPESGKSVTYTIVVTNDGVDPFTLKTLSDDRFGDLDGVGTCDIPQVIASGTSYTCAFTTFLKSDVLTPHVNIVTASGTDPENHLASDTDDASVAFTDVLPDISLTKVANPTAARWTGDYVDYTLTITNNSVETIVVTSLVDGKFTLSAECLALIGQYIASGASKQCLLPDMLVSGSAGGSFTNTATVAGADNESNVDTATASATVNFWWFGRTPGYWKNHPEAWTSGYTPGNFIQTVFAIPSALLSSGNLDLDRNGSKDTLLSGLSYKGGSTLSGGAQILMRAAIAALLNEAYYGADFPIASSPSDLISQVNTVLATQSRSQYVSFASYLDYWNNAVHASLP